MKPSELVNSPWNSVSDEKTIPVIASSAGWLLTPVSSA